ncbi:MFS transporter [Bosea sp. Root381]|uniref:MFS transporter n=1 Tax=Bosea sp. Root381 TaxID=1736524 RepID=UPI0006F9A1A1|nr:MFS transporter [Bosea sp. Root381]KRE04939.1 MFS transporter [Bosea sp. Root381]
MSDRRLVVGALGITQILAWGSSTYLPAVLNAPVAADTGWPLGWVAGGLSAGQLMAAAVSPRVGRAIGEWGGRIVLAASAGLLAIGLATIGAAPSLPVYVLGWTIIGAGMGAGLYDAAFATLGTIYGQSARSAITTLTLYGGFASTVCWPLSAFLVERYGWRSACFVYAGIQVLVSLPLLLATLPRRQVAEVSTSEADVAPPAVDKRRRLQLLLLTIALPLSAFVSSVVSVQLLTLLQAAGATLAVAVGYGMLIGPAQVGGRIVEMTVGKRFDALWTLLSGAALIALGLILIWTGLPILAIAIVVYGAGNGVWSIARGAVPLALLGRDDYAAVMGRLARPALLASAAAPFAAGVMFERGGVALSQSVLAILAVVDVLVVMALVAVTFRAKTPAA